MRQMLPFTTETQAFLHKWQHRSDCANARWTTVREHYYGLGSQIHVNTAGFAAAINAGAIFLMAASDVFYDAETKRPVSACSNLFFDCVLVPISNCTRETLSPNNRVYVNPYESQFIVPEVFANVSTNFPLYYWWRAQAVCYFLHYNARLRDDMRKARELYANFGEIKCGSVCVHVRHGDKGREMRLVEWRRFEPLVFSALEMLHSRLERAPCRSSMAERAVFLTTDNVSVLQEARQKFGNLLYLNDSVTQWADGRTPSNYHNLVTALVNIESCLKCDAFVLQRGSNFARLIDEPTRPHEIRTSPTSAALMVHFMLIFVIGYWFMPIQRNRAFILSATNTTSANAIDAWSSPACKYFYGALRTYHGSANDYRTAPERLSRILALEDLHVGGRISATLQHLPAQEIVVSLEYKFGYIVQRKCASTPLLEILQRDFGANWFWCHTRCGDLNFCYVLNNRCTTLALSQVELDTFFFFTFVRNPLTRWFSQYAQSHVMWSRILGPQGHPDSVHHIGRVNKAHALEALYNISHLANIGEHHLQTQTVAASSWTAYGGVVPLQFIGRLESFRSDLEDVYKLISAKSGVAVPTPNFDVHHHAEEDEFIPNIDTFRNSCQILNAITTAYTQDFVCFGYDLRLSAC